MKISRIKIKNNNTSACQAGLGECGASLSLPGRLVLSDLTEAGNRQMVNVRHVMELHLEAALVTSLMQLRFTTICDAGPGH